MGQALQEFLPVFQTNDPLIHILLPMLQKSLRMLLVRFRLVDCTPNKELSNIDIAAAENQLKTPKKKLCVSLFEIQKLKVFPETTRIYFNKIA